MASPTYWRDPKNFQNRLTVEENKALLKLGMPSPSIVEWSYSRDRWEHIIIHCFWLKETDREAVETACMLLGEVYFQFDEMVAFRKLPREERELVKRQPGIDEKTVNAAVRVLAMLGCTPTTRGRLLLADEDGKKDKGKKNGRYQNWSAAA